MGQIDSLVADTVVYGISNVSQNNGWNIAFSGLLMVFGGLVLISVTIFIFNKIAEKMDKTDKQPSIQQSQPDKIILSDTPKKIPEDHLVAITTAIELYRRLHLESLESAITFERGDINPNWKTGARFGQRKSMR